VIDGLPKELVARALTWDDVEAVFRIEQASEAFDDGLAEIELSDVEAEWRRPAFDLATMSVGVFDADRLLAYAEVFGTHAEAVVAPAERGRGLGAAVARWTWAVAAASGRDRVAQTVSDTEDAARALFESLGYEPGHTAWILRIDVDEEPSPPTLPDGITFHPYRPGIDEPQLFDVIETAFSAWESREPNTFEDWAEQMIRRDEVRSDLQVLVADGDRLVGAAINYDYEADAEGWIQQLAVHPTHQRRGLGRALLQESFRRFYAVGRRTCGLTTDSRTGALGLYEHVGMRVRKSYTQWVKRL